MLAFLRIASVVLTAFSYNCQWIFQETLLMLNCLITVGCLMRIFYYVIQDHLRKYVKCVFESEINIHLYILFLNLWRFYLFPSGHDRLFSNVFALIIKLFLLLSLGTEEICVLVQANTLLTASKLDCALWTSAVFMQSGSRLPNLLETAGCLLPASLFTGTFARTGSPNRK